MSENGSSNQSGFHLGPLRDTLTTTQQLGDWIASAHEHQEEFPPDVVTKVIGDYLAQYNKALPGLLEAAEAASKKRQQLADTAQELEDKKTEVESQIDEFKLRHVIGELTSDEFTARETEARATVDEDGLRTAREGMAEIDGLLNEVGEVQNKVADIQGAFEGRPESSSSSDMGPEAPDQDLGPSAPSGDLGEVAYASGASDEWAVDAGADSAEVRVGDPDAVAAEVDVEAAVEDASVEQASESLSVSIEPGLGPADEDADAAPIVEAAIEEVADAEEEHQELLETGMAQPSIDVSGEIPAQIAQAPGEGTRLSVTVPGGEAVIYPFNGDVMSLGRGRNNDIQIKNDGKISRYHCRIFRRGDEYVVEDNKSSNGTLVDGKLVTRQRLKGGELVQLGETRVQFYLT